MNTIHTIPCEENATPAKGQTKRVFHVREVTAKYSGVRRVSVKIREPDDVGKFARRVAKDNSREHFVAMYLDGAHQVVSYSIVTTGTATSTHVHPREVFQHAVLVGAAAITVAHNHPSGNLEPSDEDRQVTKVLVEAGKLMGIQILDHVIFSDLGQISLKERGYIS